MNTSRARSVFFQGLELFFPFFPTLGKNALVLLATICAASAAEVAPNTGPFAGGESGVGDQCRAEYRQWF